MTKLKNLRKEKLKNYGRNRNRFRKQQERRTTMLNVKVDCRARQMRISATTSSPWRRTWLPMRFYLLQALRRIWLISLRNRAKFKLMNLINPKYPNMRFLISATKLQIHQYYYSGADDHLHDGLARDGLHSHVQAWCIMPLLKCTFRKESWRERWRNVWRGRWV